MCLVFQRWLGVKAMAAAAACAILVAPLTAHAKGGVTMRDALEDALTSSPELAAQYQALRQLDEGVAQARAGFRPTINGRLTVGSEVSDNQQRVRPTTQWTETMSATLTLRQSLFDGFQTHYAIEGALAQVESGRFNLFQIEQTVLLNAITAYVQILTAKQNVRLARNNLDVIEKQLQAARDRFEVGEVTRTDVAQAEAALAQSQANLATQKGALRQASEAYRRFVGARAPSYLAKLPPLPEMPDSLDEARDVAMSRRPSILAAQSNVNAATAEIKRAEGAMLPQVTLDATADASSSQTSGPTNNANSKSLGAVVTLTMPFYQGGALRSAVRQRKAVESQRYHELRQTARTVMQEVGDAWEDLQTARATNRANRRQIKAQQVAFEGVREEAKVGSRTTLDVLEAEQDLLNARVALVTSRANEQINAYRLLSAIGVLNIETLGLDIAREDPTLYHDWVQAPLVSHNIEIEGAAEDDDWLNNWRP